jgi:hypothetical protein
MFRGFPLQSNIFMLKQISAILTRTIASVLRILQLFFIFFHMWYICRRRSQRMILENTFFYFSRRFQPVKRRIEEGGEERCERK